LVILSIWFGIVLIVQSSFLQLLAGMLRQQQT